MEFCSTLRVRNYCLCVSAITKIVYLFTIFVIVCKLKLVSEMFYVTLKYTKIPDLTFLTPWIFDVEPMVEISVHELLNLSIYASIGYLTKLSLRQQVLMTGQGNLETRFLLMILFFFISLCLKISKYKENGAIYYSN